MEQVLCSHITSLVYSKVKGSNNGLLEFTEALFRDAVLADQELSDVFGSALRLYRKDCDYFSQLKISKENEISSFVESCLDNSNIKLCKDGLKFLSFLLSHNRTQLTKIAFYLIARMKKKTINEVDFKTAVRIIYGDCPVLFDKLYKKIETVATRCKDSKANRKVLGNLRR